MEDFFPLFVISEICGGSDINPLRANFGII